MSWYHFISIKLYLRVIKLLLCEISLLCMKDISELHTINKFHQHSDTSGGKGISKIFKLNLTKNI